MFETNTAIIIGDGKYFMPTWKKIIVCCILIICFCGLYMILSRFNVKKKFINGPTNTETITIVSRDECEILQPVKQARTTQPVSYVVISHTTTSSFSCLHNCCKLIRAIERYQITDRKYNNIGYNFLIDIKPTIAYEGRGWNVQPHAYYNYKNNSLSIALIGNFSKERPVDSQLRNLKKFIQYGVKKGYINGNYTLLGHRQFRATESPGQYLYDIITKWDHWSSN